jgi:hypothetical protein
MIVLFKIFILPPIITPLRFFRPGWPHHSLQPMYKDINRPIILFMRYSNTCFWQSDTPTYLHTYCMANYCTTEQRLSKNPAAELCSKPDASNPHSHTISLRLAHWCLFCTCPILYIYPGPKHAFISHCSFTHVTFPTHWNLHDMAQSRNYNVSVIVRWDISILLLIYRYI